MASGGACRRVARRGRSCGRVGGCQTMRLPFGETIDTDLAEYGFSLLRASLALREIEGNPEIWRGGFARAGNAFEALVQNGSPEGTHRGFFRVIGAASYHLAGYSALAFSLIALRP